VQPADGSDPGIVLLVVVGATGTDDEGVVAFAEDDEELHAAASATSTPAPNECHARRRFPIAVQSVSRPRRLAGRQAYAYRLRQARSKGRRHASGATSWWIAFGPHEPAL
jgi:hypothetical protein